MYMIGFKGIFVITVLFPVIFNTPEITMSLSDVIDLYQRLQHDDVSLSS